ncbi:tautomerase family protein [Bradyrhizobium erythrophlei]|uniref:tautomerase family protein n=1 Tax=Bradyrhizobium erythrophlei TaxID=1437360 RepID=UPI000A4CC639
MPMISCDMRYGRSEEQKRALSAGLLRVVGEATGELAENIFFVIREGSASISWSTGNIYPSSSRVTRTTKN